ncbi:hypothetical protein [Priestia flexa]|uniref:Phage protein n=1 Tax=Priestia flexa TaxID=86664 RepID=A0ABU4J283_9BACI|nr:hypothetical protein [Priestia flexa]MDW8515107.1 hypothetical protein [Priestia flexa]
MSKIPNSVKVAGVDYQVVRNKEYVQIGSNKNYRGMCDSNLGVIELVAGLGESVEEQVFAHELVHVMLDQAGYDEHDEDMVNRLGIVLHQVLKDNELYFGEKQEEDRYAEIIQGKIDIKRADGHTIVTAGSFEGEVE